MDNRETVVCQSVGALAISLPLAIWLTLGSLRLLRHPRAIDDGSLLADWVKDAADPAHHAAIYPDDVRFYVWMAFLAALGLDVCVLIALSAILYNTLAP